MTGPGRKRAVVLGASMAGLFPARVLADTYPEVVIVERDRLPEPGVRRRGVPQGPHLHGLLARGHLAVEDLLPGITAELDRAGVRSGDLGTQIRWYFDGRQLRRQRSGLMVVGGDRPTIEWHVRRRVLALPRVRTVENADVQGPVITGGRVTGVRIHHRDGAGPEMLDAALVVDATGRGSRTPAWLAQAGYAEVPQEKVPIRLTYTSARFRLPSDPFGDDVSVNVVATPAHPRGAFLATLGDNRALVSLTGILGDRAPTERDGFLEYARSLPVPDVFDAVRDAEWLDEPTSFHFPASVRRRYERMPRLPHGLLVLGDAVCSFNPVYGQGITVAALQAQTLRRHTGGDPQPFFAEIARVVDAPWDIAAGGDLAHPGVDGPRDLKVRMVNTYMAKVQSAATADGRVTEAFLRVAGLIDRPESIMRPSVLLRVARARPVTAPALPAPATADDRS